MAIRTLAELVSFVQKNDPLTLVVVSANDYHTVAAVKRAVEDKIVKAVLVGNESEITSVCRDHHIDPALFRIIDQPKDDEAAICAIEMIRQGRADILMKGLISTDRFMKAVLDKEKGLVEPGKLLTHVTVIENRNYHKLLTVSDVAVIPQPSLDQKITMIGYLSKIAQALQIEYPKIAAIAPTEKIIQSILSTTEAASLAEMSRNGEIMGCIVNGPLAVDVALNAEAARIKGINSPVAGDADCLLFPNIDAGNVFYKTNTVLARAETAAMLVGARVPAVLSSRGDSILTKHYSIALAALMAQKGNML